MNDVIVNIIFQAGMVGAFIFFALKLNESHSKERTERDNQWRGFLEGERQYREASMKAITDSIEKHEERAAERTQTIVEEVRKTG